LFSTVLIGQEELGAKLSMRKEVFWRAHIIELNESAGWWRFDDRVSYLKHVYGEAITAKARQRIATLQRVPL
ncbi:hypothetical protein GWO43_09025, partial [candidate division KSB1 bacterium]|nr:hypothetical protein [candidate division KSB1 bacterium]NIR73093.1 hypothetical protein [candidate division KSB1 bacterium]NIS24102.1 hypothetical protein [candidate division KSB1 bacterium]NIT71022.1 hypothetical protein [candidate division KSB1 bacterium]NIU24722.1 hypothetical protein [candidate division KSB1 bacterium]